MIDVGTVKLKLRDRTIRTLKDVRHIPRLKINLISLCVLVKEWYVFKGHGEELYVNRGSIMCLKDELKNGIYS